MALIGHTHGKDVYQIASLMFQRMDSLRCHPYNGKTDPSPSLAFTLEVSQGQLKDKFKKYYILEQLRCKRRQNEFCSLKFFIIFEKKTFGLGLQGIWTSRHNLGS